ncbi:MAG: hypothetical protein CL927_07555 [Deltaproteobacteria bacterium]|nr:hypothetical protein [Deltaproteobacteria bacterium]HCH66450.1 hypothetical protein [Deltaproteobacteria bacterium]|tara:strand:- start:25 stop:447 length:423 start_codon:yes stop_codon:yes gene_type:complete
MNRIVLFSISLFASACVESSDLDTGAAELESSMEVHEVDFGERKGLATAYELSTSEAEYVGVLVGAAGNSCKGLKNVSDECCDLVQDVLDGDTSSTTCQEMSRKCPSIGFPSHNKKVYEAQMKCIGWGDDSLDEDGLGTP